MGHIFTTTKAWVLKNGDSASLIDTHLMYTLYGDPSLILYNTYWNYSDSGFTTNFEIDNQMPKQNERYQTFSMNFDTIGIGNSSNAYGRIYHSRMYQAVGQEISVVPNSYLWTMYDLSIPLDSNHRFISFYAKIPEHPSGLAKVNINGLLSSGAYLSDDVDTFEVLDHHGIGMSASEREDSVWSDEPRFFAFDISPHYNDTLQKLFIEYQGDGIISNPVWFRAYFDNIELGADWGLIPLVEDINMQLSIPKNDSTIASIYADDFIDQVYKGDSLTYIWEATHGSFTGSGSQVVYHAPDYTFTNVIVTCTVSDKGGHIIEKTKYIHITEPDPGGCPVFYVWAGNRYEKDNVILTGSEDPVNENLAITDYCPISIPPDLIDNIIKIKITEEEKEITYIDQIELLAIPYKLYANERLAIKTNGELVAISNPVSPKFATSDLGHDLTKGILNDDGSYFTYYGQGDIILGFPNVDSIFNLSDTGLFSLDEGPGGGIGDPPPDKEFWKVNQDLDNNENEFGNYVTVHTLDQNSNFVNINRIYPRISRTLPLFTDLTEYVIGQKMPIVKISWEKKYRSDQIAFYKSRPLSKPTLLTLKNAITSRGKSQVGVISQIDRSYFELTPNQSIDLEFSIPEQSNMNNIQYILKVTGYYIRNTLSLDDKTEEKYFSINQNYPNPFNSGTEIILDISKNLNLKVDIYNILGQRVKSLFDDEAKPGILKIHWDATNESNISVASGIYFCIVASEDNIESRKMLMIK